MFFCALLGLCVPQETLHWQTPKSFAYLHLRESYCSPPPILILIPSKTRNVLVSQRCGFFFFWVPFVVVTFSGGNALKVSLSPINRTEESSTDGTYWWRDVIFGMFPENIEKGEIYCVHAFNENDFGCFSTARRLELFKINLHFNFTRIIYSTLFFFIFIDTFFTQGPEIPRPLAPSWCALCCAIIEFKYNDRKW